MALDLVPPLDEADADSYCDHIVVSLAAAIGRGELAAGERLPTVRQLADSLGVNFNTVARAYRRLEADGLARPHRGRGTFVAGVDRAGEAAGAPDLETMVNSFLARVYRRGYSAQDVRWELAGAIRTWMQEGEPPGGEG
ncbi:MAG TPA: winged helix-turn-helix domain-containing protein [Anaerolineales bacterium]|jgi:GntR family transcriptional regulator